MDELITELERLTAGMADSLDQADDQAFSAFVDERQAIIDQLQEQALPPQQAAKYRERVMRLLEHDDHIISRMQQLKDEASEQLAKLKQGREQRQVYEAAYTPDSIFFDRKK